MPPVDLNPSTSVPNKDQSMTSQTVASATKPDGESASFPSNAEAIATLTSPSSLMPTSTLGYGYQMPTERFPEIINEPTRQHYNDVQKRLFHAGQNFLDNSSTKLVSLVDLDLQTQFDWLHKETRGWTSNKEMLKNMPRGKWDDFTVDGEQQSGLRKLMVESGVSQGFRNERSKRAKDSPQPCPCQSRAIVGVEQAPCVHKRKASSMGDTAPQLSSKKSRCNTPAMNHDGRNANADEENTSVKRADTAPNATSYENKTTQHLPQSNHDGLLVAAHGTNERRAYADQTNNMPDGRQHSHDRQADRENETGKQIGNEPASSTPDDRQHPESRQVNIENNNGEQASNERCDVNAGDVEWLLDACTHPDPIVSMTNITSYQDFHDICRDDKSGKHASYQWGKDSSGNITCVKLKYPAVDVAKPHSRNPITSTSVRIYEDFAARREPVPRYRNSGTEMVARQKHGTMPLFREPDWNEFYAVANSVWQAKTSSQIPEPLQAPSSVYASEQRAARKPAEAPQTAQARQVAQGLMLAQAQWPHQAPMPVQDPGFHEASKLREQSIERGR